MRVLPSSPTDYSHAPQAATTNPSLGLECEYGDPDEKHSLPHIPNSIPANTHAISATINPRCSEFLRIIDERNLWIPSQSPHFESRRSRVKTERPIWNSARKCSGKMHTGSPTRYSQHSGKSHLVDHLGIVPIDSCRGCIRYTQLFTKDSLKFLYVA